jgi:hypothetical protein
MTTTEAAPDPPSRDRLFNPYRAPHGPPAAVLVSRVLMLLESHEKLYRPRKRRRRAADQARLEAQVAALVCDLAHRHLTAPGDWLSLSLSNNDLSGLNRYAPAFMTGKVRQVLESLSSPRLQLVEMEKGFNGPPGIARRTTIRAGSMLRAWIEDDGIRLDHLSSQRTGETIILKAPKAEGQKHAPWIDYEDNPETDLMRRQMAAINSWLAEADISFGEETDQNGRPVDESQRYLRRFFTNGTFRHGGRLFGGWWQNLASDLRADGLAIDGEPVVTLDYRQMGPAILYSLTGKAMEVENAYTLPGLEQYRDGVKKVFSAVLFNKVLERFPPETRPLFPSWVKFGEVLTKLEQIHAPVRHHFFTGIGHRIMNVESNILVDVLLGLRDQGIVGLPVHDAAIVPQSRAHEARTIMLDCFRAHTNTEGRVTEG